MMLKEGLVSVAVCVLCHSSPCDRSAGSVLCVLVL